MVIFEFWALRYSGRFRVRRREGFRARSSESTPWWVGVGYGQAPGDGCSGIALRLFALGRRRNRPLDLGRAQAGGARNVKPARSGSFG